MVIRHENSRMHDDCCGAGANSSSIKASIAAAWAADPQLDSSGIVIKVLGPIAVLEGYLSATDHRDVAIRIAEVVVGAGNVQDRMLFRYSAEH